ASRADGDGHESHDRSHGDGEREDRPPRGYRRGRPVARIGERDDLPGTLPRLLLAGNTHVLEIYLHPTRSLSVSSPRRRRWFTVPRGRLRSSAISPGVKPRR